MIESRQNFFLGIAVALAGFLFYVCVSNGLSLFFPTTTAPAAMTGESTAEALAIVGAGENF